MENLLKEMEEFLARLEQVNKEVMERIIRVNAEMQNGSIRDFSNLLTTDHRSTNNTIDLIGYQIRDLKEKIEKGNA